MKEQILLQQQTITKGLQKPQKKYLNYNKCIINLEIFKEIKIQTFSKEEKKKWYIQ